MAVLATLRRLDPHHHHHNNNNNNSNSNNNNNNNKNYNNKSCDEKASLSQQESDHHHYKKKKKNKSVQATTTTTTTTTTTPRLNKNQSSAATCRERRRRRNVTFADQPPTVVVLLADDDDDDCCDDEDVCHRRNLWYSADDLRQMKRQGSDVIKALVRERVSIDGNGHTIDVGSYADFYQGIVPPWEACCGFAAQQHHLHYNTHQHDFALPPDQQSAWEQLYRDFPERLGLERLAFTPLRHDKSARRLALVSTLHSLPQLLEEQLDLHHDPPLASNSNSSRDEIIRSLCHGITLPSQLFAQQLGRAVAASCHEDDENDENKKDQHTTSAAPVSRLRHCYHAGWYPCSQHHHHPQQQQQAQEQQQQQQERHHHCCSTKKTPTNISRKKHWRWQNHPQYE